MAACIGDFSAHAEAEHDEAGDVYDNYLAQLTAHAEAAYDDMVALGESTEAQLAADNDARRAAFYDYSQGLLDAFHADIDVHLGKVDAWFGDRLEWIEKLYDSYYKTHLIAELEAKRDASTASLNERRVAAQDLADEGRHYLDHLLQDHQDYWW